MPALDSALRFLRLSVQRFTEERCIQVAGSLTFTTLLALVPLITMMFSMISAFPVFEDISTQLKIFILMNMVPEVGGKVITVYMQQFADNAAGLTALGIVFIAITALLLLLTIERVFNVIWRVRRERPMLTRMLIYWAALTTGPLLIGASFSITSWLVTQSMGLVTLEPTVGNAVLKAVPLLLNALAFGLLYLALPNRWIRPLDALAGGIVAAALFEAMKQAFGVYITRVPTYTLVYGAFASIPIFLLWIYLMWLVVLAGAVVVAVLPRWRAGGGRTERDRGTRFFPALRVLRELVSAHRRGDLPAPAVIARAAGLGDDEVDDVLEALAQAGWAAKGSGKGWVLARDAGAITVADVYRCFVFRPPQVDADSPARALEPEFERLAGALTQRIEDAMPMTLATLFGTPDDPAPAPPPEDASG